MLERISALDEKRTHVFLRHRAALLRYLAARGAGNDADDLLQELWLRLKGAPAHIDEPRAYLYRIAHNLMLDRARQIRRRSSHEQAFCQMEGIHQSDHRAPNVEHALVARERLEVIDRALAALGPKTEAIFRRARVDRVPQRQIAAERDISLSAVEKHLQKAYRAVADAQRLFDLEDRGLSEPDHG